ncbi:MAG: hypothetical protein IH946_00910, partial [Bacteroidetes bacterium]|nr:hypothetical protein [Bacteroidota bacterium]
MRSTIFCLFLLFVACTQQTKELASDPVPQELPETQPSGPKDATPEIKPEMIIGENYFKGISLKMSYYDDIDALVGSVMTDFQVSRETGTQDGPDFPMVLVKDGETELFYFAMDHDDDGILNEVVIMDENVKDVYGLRIGDSYGDIKKRRSGIPVQFVDEHFHTFLFYENSKIMYEVSGETDEERIELAMIGLSDRLSVNTDRETGVVSFSVTTADPNL